MSKSNVLAMFAAQEVELHPIELELLGLGEKFPVVPGKTIKASDIALKYGKSAGYGAVLKSNLTNEDGSEGFIKEWNAAFPDCPIGIRSDLNTARGKKARNGSSKNWKPKPTTENVLKAFDDSEKNQEVETEVETETADDSVE